MAAARRNNPFNPNGEPIHQGGSQLYRNDWLQYAPQDMPAVDAWLVPEAGWRSLTGREAPLNGDVPAIIMGVREEPLIIVPSRATARRTQKAFKEAAQLGRSIKAKTIGLWLQDFPGHYRRAALWGVGQGLYQYRPPEELTTGPQVAVVSDELLHLEFSILQEQAFVRDLINIPSNLKPPARLSELMQQGSPEAINWTAFAHDALQDMGAGGILAVGMGSHRPPVMLVGRYQGKPGAPVIALVGKGITFDSGGISLKPGEGMGRMKGDMGGAAAVVGAIRAIARQQLPVNVLAVLPLAENLPGGGAYRPGDVLTMMDGTLVEIISTDAEGRLVLADGVSWASNQGAAAIVDIATLTGANVVALGGIRSGLLTNDERLADIVKEAADRASEPTWELPHDEDYIDFIKTSAGDIKNSGGRPAGTITAGLFIRHFARSVPWAHLDIAGLSFAGEGGTIGAGATGYGVATLVEICREFSAIHQ